MSSNMDVTLDNLLDVALGGPEIGPLNLSVLHGVLREVFSQLNISGRRMTIAQENPDFSDSFNFIKSKIDEDDSRPRSAGGRPSKIRSKVSVIISDYARSSIPTTASVSGTNPTGSSVVLPAAAEERLAYIESQMKLVQNFPSVNELKSWAGQNKNPDTVVTDLWHFVSLSHRMNGVEEGIQKVSDLVDKLLPEMRMLSAEQTKRKEELVRHQGKLDDLYSQLKALSDRTTRVSDKLDHTDEFTQKFYEDQQNEKLNTRKELEKTARKEDLNIFIPRHEIKQNDAKFEHDILKINENLSTKAPLSRVDQCAEKGDLKNLENWMKAMQSQLENAAEKGEVVTWSNLENGLNGQLGGRSSSIGALSPRGDSVSVAGPGGPSKGLVENLERIGGLAEKQRELMDALDSTRDQLAKKAHGDELSKFVTKAELDDILNNLKNLRNNMEGLHSWRDKMEETCVPDMERSIEDLERQMKETLKLFKRIKDDDKNNANQIENLFTYVDRLEENKASKQDVDRIVRTLPTDAMVTMQNHNNDVDLLNRKLKDLHDRLQLSEGELSKGMDKLTGHVEQKLNRDELRPLREYLENRFRELSQPPPSSDRHRNCFHSSHSPVPQRAASARSLPAACCDNTAGTVIQPGEDAAILRKQMKFNCLSCNRPLAISNGMSSRSGKPLSAHELDQMRQLQPLLKGDNPNSSGNRACGGTHTSGTSVSQLHQNAPMSAGGSKRITAKIGDQTQEVFQNQIASGEVDIEGIDGKLYKGMLNKSQNHGRHNRARSAGATSPSRMPPGGRMRPMSSKSSIEIPAYRPTTPVG